MAFRANSRQSSFLSQSVITVSWLFVFLANSGHIAYMSQSDMMKNGWIYPIHILTPPAIEPNSPNPSSMAPVSNCISLELPLIIMTTSSKIQRDVKFSSSIAEYVQSPCILQCIFALFMFSTEVQKQNGKISGMEQRRHNFHIVALVLSSFN